MEKLKGHQQENRRTCRVAVSTDVILHFLAIEQYFQPAAFCFYRQASSTEFILTDEEDDIYIFIDMKGAIVADEERHIHR